MNSRLSILSTLPWAMLATAVLLVCVAAPASSEICDPHPSGRFPIEELEWRTGLAISTGEMVLEASEHWAASHDGLFPGNVAVLMRSWLGGPSFLWGNSFTNGRTEPIDGVAGFSGAVGYEAYARAGDLVGANVTVYGRTAVTWTEATGPGVVEPLTYTRPTRTLQDRLDEIR